jgi:hypothetical protein
MMRDSIVPATDWKPSDGLDQMARWWPGEDWASLADSYLDTFATMHAGGIPGHCMRQAIGALVREGNQRVPSPARVAAGIMAQVAEYERERKAGLHVREAHHPQPSWWPAPAEPPCSCGGVMALNRHPAYLFCQRCCSVRPAETTDGRVRVHMTDHERLGVRTSTRDAWTVDRIIEAREAIQAAAGDVVGALSGMPDLHPLWREARRREERGERVDWGHLAGVGARFRSVGQWLAWRDKGATLPPLLSPRMDDIY